MATALYFIDKLALRAGHEKDEDEADTVGCCTLKVGRSVVRWGRGVGSVGWLALLGKERCRQSALHATKHVSTLTGGC